MVQAIDSIDLSVRVRRRSTRRRGCAHGRGWSTLALFPPEPAALLRISFRQTMLAAFLLSAALLAWAALGGWLLLERYATASRQAGERAVRVRSAQFP